MFCNLFYDYVFYRFSTISFLIVAICLMGTLTEYVKGSIAQKEACKIIVEQISGIQEENNGISNGPSQDADEKEPQDISMHAVTISEKS